MIGKLRPAPSDDHLEHFVVTPRGRAGPIGDRRKRQLRPARKALIRLGQTLGEKTYCIGTEGSLYQFGVFQDISVNFGNLSAESEDAQWTGEQQKGRGNDGKEVLLKREGEVEILTTAGDDGAESGVIAEWRRRVHGGALAARPWMTEGSGGQNAIEPGPENSRQLVATCREQAGELRTPILACRLIGLLRRRIEELNT